MVRKRIKGCCTEEYLIRRHGKDIAERVMQTCRADGLTEVDDDGKTWYRFCVVRSADNGEESDSTVDLA